MTESNHSSLATHVAYSDESHYNIGRYRGVAVVSLRRDDCEHIVSALRGIIERYSLTEMGWKKLDGATAREAAKAMLSCALYHANSGQLRMDVLTWDTQDSRHSVRNRDDIANLGRMYYHVLNNALCERWPNESHWILHPDEQSAMNWETLRSCLSWTEFEMRPKVNDDGEFNLFLSLRYLLSEISECRSHQEPLIQLADLLAGLCIYSRTSFDRFAAWLRVNYTDEDLEACYQGVTLGAVDGERCHLLRWLYLQCRKNKMGVSLLTRNGLRTAQPHNALNFWWYEVQHPDDKAPQKEKKVKKKKVMLPGLD